MADPTTTAIHEATLDLARTLIRRPSVTPADGGCLDLISGRLEAAGFACERLDRGGVRNLWARRGRAAPLVCLAGHVDVVPPGPVADWTGEPFSGAERDGWLYGRGAADMKTSVAAMVTAAERLAAASPAAPGSLALLLTSDEEGTATDGTVAVVETLAARDERIDACLIGEPTSSARLGDTVKNGRRGSLNGTLTVRGIACHVAYPELGRNPIHAALPALAELAGVTWDDGDGPFQPTSFQMTNVHAGTGAVNVIPPTLDVQFNFRFCPASSEASLRQRVQAILEGQGLEFELAWQLAGSPFVTRSGRLVDTIRRVVRQVTGVTPELSTSGGTSDGRFLASIAREVVEFGPVNTSIHKPDERVWIADIAPLSLVYEQTAAALLAG